MKYFAIFYKNVETIFQLQLKIGNISDMFLQYSVLCGICYEIFSAGKYYCNLRGYMGFEGQKKSFFSLIFFNILNELFLTKHFKTPFQLNFIKF